MPDNLPISPTESPRALGRRLACEAILRTAFGARTSTGLDRALDQIRRDEKISTAQFPTLLAFAAAIVLFLGLPTWYFTARVGSPFIAKINGSATIERAGQSFLVQEGSPLFAGDLLHTAPTGTVTIAFGPENTLFTVHPSTKLGFTSLTRGKHFHLTAGKLEASVARQRPFKPMLIRTPNAQVRVLGTKFALTATTNSTRLDVSRGKVHFTRLSDQTRALVTAGHYAVAAEKYELAALPMTGHINRQWWTDIKGSQIDALYRNARFPNTPDGGDLADSIELEPIQTNSFGLRFFGYLHPPVTGNYEFWLTGATDAELFMSPNDNPVKKVRIAQIGSGAHRVWDQPRFHGGSNWSSPTPLIAGHIYYIEAIVLVEKGQGHLAAAWKPPGGNRELLPGQYLSPAAQRTLQDNEK